MTKTDKELTTEIVASVVGNPHYTFVKDEVIDLIKEVYKTLAEKN